LGKVVDQASAIFDDDAKRDVAHGQALAALTTAFYVALLALLAPVQLPESG